MAVKIRAATSWERRIPRLERIADGKARGASASDSIAAMRELRAVGFAETMLGDGATTLVLKVVKE